MPNQVCLIFKDGKRPCWDFKETYQAKNWAEELMIVFPGQWEGPVEQESVGCLRRVFRCTGQSPLDSIEVIVER